MLAEGPLSDQLLLCSCRPLTEAVVSPKHHQHDDLTAVLTCVHLSDVFVLLPLESLTKLRFLREN